MHYLRSLFLILFSSFHLSWSSPLSVSGSNSNKNDYSLCASFDYRCGDQSYKIYYPFRVVARSAPFCGHPNFELSCTSDNKTLVAHISDKAYQVISMDYDTQLLHVTELEFVDQSCVQTFTNTSINPSLFDYSIGDTNLTVLFNCSYRFPSLDGLRNITCSDSYPEHYSFYIITMPTMLNIWQVCNSIAAVPINGSLVDGLMMNYEDYAGKFMETLKKGFGLTWKVGDGWCSKCTNSDGICWSNPTSDSDSQNSSGECYCGHGNTGNGGVCVPNKTSRKRKKTKIIIEAGSAAALGFLLVCLSLALYFYKHGMVFKSVIFQKKNLNDNKKMEAFLEEYESIIPRRYSYSNVKKMTRAFQEKLGQGGYGTVFKGTLDNGHMVAVKILNDSKGDGEEFINEVASIGRTSHVNVVNLLGFCYEGSKRALIYDFMCNGSLEKLLYSEMPKTTTDWEKLYKIAIGIARGLEYLHRGCNTRIVHFDIKPHNILLDQDFCPKISDFGLAKLCLKKESIISIAGARGTIGYIAPEVFSRNFGVVSSKSDVYSYGMMVLEITGGRKNPNEGVQNSSETYFPHWIYAQLDKNSDLLSCGVTAESEEIARKMILVGLWCIQTMPENRPSMSRAIEMMEGSVDDLQIPPKPYLSSSPFGPIVGTSSIQDICYTTLTITQSLQIPQDVSATKSLLKP